MHTATTGRTRPVIDRRNNRAVRDIAKLRARRAARLAAESAAGRRRMVVTGVCALSTVILGIVIAATSIAWAWLVVPVAALVASLAASRVAAVRSQRASDRELEQLTKLRADVRGAGRPTAPAPQPRVVDAARGGDEAVAESALSPPLGASRAQASSLTSRWQTWWRACTPASVRPATVVVISSREAMARAASISPWTVRKPGWAAHPRKSVPS